MSAEIPIHGAGLIDRKLVRVGDTVRRPRGTWTASVHGVLDHLAATGFPLSPKPLGYDDSGREILTFLPGEDCGWPLQPSLLHVDGARRMGELVRDLHAALATYPCPPDAVWQFARGAPRPEQSIQHGDLGPWNLIWNDGIVTGIIDWDFTHPGDDRYDLGHLAWFTVPFMDDERARERGFPEPPHRGGRLEAFAEGCGLTPGEVTAAALAAQQTYADRVAALDIEPWRTFRSVGLDANAGRDRSWTERIYS